MKKRVISLVLVFVLIFCALPPLALAGNVGLDNFKTVKAYAANQFTDVLPANWFYANVKRSYELNLIDGRSENTFSPYENVTLAEAVKLAACLHSIYYTGTLDFQSGDPWYTPYTDYAIKYGIIDADPADYNAPATRRQFAQIFASALPSDALSRINSIPENAIPDVPSGADCADAVYLLYRAGILKCNDDKGTFYPDSNISRGEVAALVTRMADVNLRKSFSLGKTTLTAEEVFAKHAPAVFYIEIYNAAGIALASGSGFFISADGLAVTNFHVIKGATSAKIKLSDGTTCDVAGVYDYDADLDLALLQIDGNGFSCLELGDSTKLSGGATIYAIGSPLGLENSITQGIISSTSRVIDGNEYIQISAPISHGSSGGALFNTAGQVIGVTTASIENGQNLNLAVPIHKLGALSRERYVSLAAVLADGHVDISFSPTSLSVAAGSSASVAVTCSAATFDSIVYTIDNKNIATAKWGAWTSDITCPLTISGISAGTTTCLVQAFDEYENLLGSATFTIHVTGTATEKYYTDFYPAPDYGTHVNAVPCYSYRYTDGAWIYFYRLSDIKVSSTVSVSGYTALLEQMGFVYDGSFTNDDGYTTLVYTHGTYGISISFGTALRNGTPCMYVLLENM